MGLFFSLCSTVALGDLCSVALDALCVPWRLRLSEAALKLFAAAPARVDPTNFFCIPVVSPLGVRRNTPAVLDAKSPTYPTIPL